VANGRRPIPPLRAYTAAVLGVFALFVISAGAGMASWSIVVLGLALMILAVSLVVVSAMRGGTRAYVAGTAHVVSASEPPASSMYGRCELHLVVDAPGMAAAAVKIRDPRVPVAKWPDPGTTLPIMVAVDDPRRVRIQWDDVPTHAENAAEEQFLGGYAEEYTEQRYEPEDYSEEYPEYVPAQDPMAAPPQEPPPADRDRPPADDLTGLTDLLDGPVPARPDPIAEPAEEPTTEPPAPPTGPAPAPAAEPAPARATEPAPAPTAAAASGPAGTAAAPGSPAGPAQQPTRRPPAPRRPEASPETPAEEAYPVGGEPVFAPNVPPGPQAADFAAPSSAAGTGVGAAPAPGGGSHPEPAAAPPRPRPRPRPRRPNEQANLSGQPASRYGAMATVVEATGAATNTAAATNTGAARTAVADHEPAQAPPDDVDAPGPPARGEATEEAPSGPSVTAIEFDLGELVTAYPSARPGTTGPISGVGITVPVSDLMRSADFYRDVLGFYEIDGGTGSIVLASGNTRVVLREAHDAPPRDRRQVRLNLEVADVDAVYEELTAKGVKFIHGPRPTSRGERLELWSAELRDPDGHDIAISQWRNRANHAPDR
jgi:catechol 2,3-dioxygenase-like lactoylglutathione lyase family enzyme